MSNTCQRIQLPANPTPARKTLLVWGGSTSVGSNAIQLGVAAGYEVITTASPRNLDYVKKLGASQAFDYSSSTVVADLIEAFNGKTLVGALAMGSGSAGARLDVVRAYKGNKFVSMAGTPVSFERGMTFGVVLQLVSSNVSLQVKSRLRRIRTKFVFGTTLKKNEVSTVIYEDFLPQALADGRYVTAREPYVIGTGLECIQTGLEAHMKGVSARKVVVTL